jgi:hypothetical protein
MTLYPNMDRFGVATSVRLTGFISTNCESPIHGSVNPICLCMAFETGAWSSQSSGCAVGPTPSYGPSFGAIKRVSDKYIVLPRLPNSSPQMLPRQSIFSTPADTLLHCVPQPSFYSQSNRENEPNTNMTAALRQATWR